MTAIGDSTPLNTCTKCGQRKPATKDHFLVRDVRRGTLKKTCKDCAALFRKAYYVANKDVLLEKNKAYREARAQEIRAKRRKAYKENREEIIAKNLAHRAANREAHRARVSRNAKKRTRSDPVYMLRMRVSALISGRLRAGGYTKKSRSHEILGCDWEAFKAHIERQFLTGMTWDNRDKWQLDHIVPLASAKSEDDILALNHHTNLRPMWASENRAKSDKIEFLI